MRSSSASASPGVIDLCSTALYPRKEPLPPHVERPKTVGIESISADIEENGVRLRLTVVDTPGYGDFVNNDESWKPILDNIEAQFDAYLEQENRVNRVANLKMNSHGVVSGKIDLAFMGAPALGWRDEALPGDEESLHKSLREYLEKKIGRAHV